MRQLISQGSKFAVVGAMNTAVDFAVFNLLLYVGMPVLLANAISFLVAVANSYLLNKSWTFRDTSSHTVGKAAKFLLVAVVGLGISSLFVWLLNIQLGFAPNAAKLAATVVVMVWNFLATKFLVFGKNSQKTD